ncbi:sodium:solute symporter [candidate division KSB1 bacterium]|nr:sodium:solute symporter [candidate division KSB1 bacterium]
MPFTESPDWTSILPPAIAILLAVRTKQVVVSLFIGIWVGWTILSGWNPIAGFATAIEGCVRVFADASNTRVILFSTLVGALIAFTQVSGGMEGFVQTVTRRGWIRNRRSAALLAWITGMVIFVEANMSVLIAGTLSRPIFDKMRLSREKLAYICDSTSAPKCILIPFNAWGAFVIGLLADQGVERPVEAMVASMPYNFYAILAILLVLLSVVFQRDIGPMRRAERRVRETGQVLNPSAEPVIDSEVLQMRSKPGVRPRALNMLAPVLTLVVMMPLSLWITGDGNLMRGEGSTSVLWSVIAGLFVGAILYRAQKILSLKEIMQVLMNGVGGMVPLASLMLFAFAIGNVCKALGTGPFVASLSNAFVSPVWIPALLFVISCLIAFATGTSWGTFAIMMPIGIPMIGLMGLNSGAVIAAILGGGVFGDHCSPISDTTIISSMAAATDHIDHIRTQIPYALIAAGLAVVGYLWVGFIT